jgi:hypothetical protein
MTNNLSPAFLSLKITAVCLAYTVAGYFIAFGLSYLRGNSYTEVLIHGGGFFGPDQTSHDILVCAGSVVGCLIGGFVSVAVTITLLPDSQKRSTEQ